MSELFNDPNEQALDEEFNWQEIIENNDLLDEKEQNHYYYRKDKLNNMDNENDNANNMAGRGRGRSGK